MKPKEELNQDIELVHKSGVCTQSNEENKDAYIPQIAAAFVAFSYNIVLGKSFGYSAILIPQLLKAQNSTETSNSTETMIGITEADISWIASALIIVMMPAALVGGIMVDYLGRLNSIAISAIPNAIGWIIIATAKNAPMLIIGRLLNGTAIAFGLSAAIVYVTEISSPNVRGALSSISPCILSFGMMVAYLEGWLLNWRSVAWISLIYILFPVIFVTLWIPESPTWLISRNSTVRAKKSLEWFSRNKNPDEQVQLLCMQKDHTVKQEQPSVNKDNSWNMLKAFSSPAVYKPLLIITILSFFQQFSGVFVMLFYIVSFFNEVGTSVSAFLAAVLVGAVRFGMSIITIFLMKWFRRRTLLIASALGMSVSIGISGLFTDLIRESKTSLTWIPVLMVILYVISSAIGFLGIPWMIISELFPTRIRGVAQSISLGIGNSLMFASIQLYLTLTHLFGGLAGMQYFFAVMSLCGAAYCYVFVPETHNKKLSEIETYFQHQWIYLSFASGVDVNK